MRVSFILTLPMDNNPLLLPCRWFRKEYSIVLIINMTTLSRGGKRRVDHTDKNYTKVSNLRTRRFFSVNYILSFTFFFFLLFLRKCNINQSLLNISNIRNGVSSDIQPPRSNMEVICHTREEVFWHLTSIFFLPFLFSFFFFTPTSRCLNTI